MKVVILNGPPGCGKDVLADYLVQNTSARLYGDNHKREFKAKLFQVAAVLASIPVPRMVELNGRNTKELPSEELPGNRSPRQWLIYVSEVLVKPHLGLQYFGQAAAATLTDEIGVYFFADGGFDTEAKEIAAKVGKDNLLVIHLTRPGCSFIGDSRNYVHESIAGATIQIDNDGDLPSFLNHGARVVNKWLNI